MYTDFQKLLQHSQRLFIYMVRFRNLVCSDKVIGRSEVRFVYCIHMGLLELSHFIITINNIIL